MNALAADFTLPPELEAHEPPEARGLARDEVRLLVSRGRTGEIGHHRFTDLPGLLRPGDLLVVNDSATLPAAVRLDRLAVHFSTECEDGTWLVELRRRGVPAGSGTAGGSGVPRGSGGAESSGDSGGPGGSRGSGGFGSSGGESAGEPYRGGAAG
ncbi:S-adenosylmethionine:tRNA ribosyltransferase-isomerase, partial [Streptosporangium algeriense]